MKEFYQFTTTIEPLQSGAIIEDLIKNTEVRDQQTALQNSRFIDNSFHFQEVQSISKPITTQYLAKLIGKDKSSIKSIFGKAAEMTNNQKAVSEAYKAMSDGDAYRMVKLQLNINGEIITIDNLPEAVHSHHDLQSTEEITMNHIVDFLQKSFGVTISGAQRNFLNTQWNQASIMGTCATFSTLGFSNLGDFKYSNSKINPPNYVFSFDKENKLNSVEYHLQVDEKYTLGEIDQPTSKKGKFTTTVDVSNLKEIKLPEGTDPWLPHFSPKKISLSYSSNNLPCAVSEDIIKVTKKHAKFNDKPLLNMYYRVANTLSDIGNYISSKIPKIKLFSSKEESKSSYHTLEQTSKERSTSRDSIDGQRNTDVIMQAPPFAVKIVPDHTPNRRSLRSNSIESHD